MSSMKPALLQAQIKVPEQERPVIRWVVEKLEIQDGTPSRSWRFTQDPLAFDTKTETPMYFNRGELQLAANWAMAQPEYVRGTVREDRESIDLINKLGLADSKDEGLGL